MISLDEFIEKYKGKRIDFDGHYGFQCVDLIRQYIKEVLNQPQPRGVIGAKDFWINYETDPNLNQYFDKISNTPEGIPNKGNIIIWGSTYGTYGHIAVVNWANVNQFQALTQNDPIGALTILKNYNYNHILGWFSPKGNNMSEYEEAIRKSSAYDEVCKLLDQPTTTSAKDTLDKLSKIISDKERYQQERDQARDERDSYVKDGLENYQDQVLEEEDLEKGFEITGRKITKIIGDVTIETSYKKKG